MCQVRVLGEQPVGVHPADFLSALGSGHATQRVCVAQRIERLFAEQKVAGSSPAVDTKNGISEC